MTKKVHQDIKIVQVRLFSLKPLTLNIRDNKSISPGATILWQPLSALQCSKHFSNQVDGGVIHSAGHNSEIFNILLTMEYHFSFQAVFPVMCEFYLFPTTLQTGRTGEYHLS